MKVEEIIKELNEVIDEYEYSKARDDLLFKIGLLKSLDEINKGIFELNIALERCLRVYG